MRSDAELVTAVRQGERAAFGHLVDQYKGMVYGLAMSFLKDFDAAYDASQEVFLRVFLKLGQLDDPGKLPAWLRSITANVCKTWLARKPDQVGFEEIEAGNDRSSYLPSPERPDTLVEQKEERRLVRCCLDKLAEDHRQVLLLYYLGERSAAEVGRLLGISTTAVRQRLHRARRQLKEEVEVMLSDTLQRESPGDEFREEVERLLDQVKGLFQRAEYQSAVPMLERAQQLAPEDTLVALLLADAYTRGRAEEEADTGHQACNRSRILLEKLIVQDPDNLLARIKLAELRTATGPFEGALGEHEENLRLAQGGPFEAWALLCLARLHNSRRHHEEATKYYQQLIDKEPIFTGVAHREMAVSHCTQGHLPAAITHIEQATAFLESHSQEAVTEYGQSLPDRSYWKFWEGNSQYPVECCQTHYWLAGLYMKNQETKKAREHLAVAIDLLDTKELVSARPLLVQEFLQQAQTLFPELAREKLVQCLQEGSGD